MRSTISACRPREQGLIRAPAELAIWQGLRKGLPRARGLPRPEPCAARGASLRRRGEPSCKSTPLLCPSICGLSAAARTQARVPRAPNAGSAGAPGRGAAPHAGGAWGRRRAPFLTTTPFPFRSDRLCARKEHSGRPRLLPAALGAQALPLLHAGLLRGGLGGRAADDAVEQHAPGAQPLLHLDHLQLHARPDLARAQAG